MTSPTVLITGSTGFIGSHIAQHLQNAGCHVIASGRNATKRLTNSHPGCELMDWDVCSEQLPRWTGNVDAIIHTATPNDILSKDFRAGCELSIFGTERVMAFAKEYRVPKLVFLSTFQVYGQELSGSIDESSQIKCLNPYALNHYFGEEVLRSASHQPGGPATCVLRLANIFGCPGSETVNRWTLVPMCFCKTAVEHGELVLLSSGRQRRNFLSLDAFASIIQALVDENWPDNFFSLNAASDATFSIREIAEMTAEVYQTCYDKPLPIRIERNTPKESNQFQVDLTRLHTIITPQSRDIRWEMTNAIRGIFAQLRP